MAIAEKLEEGNAPEQAPKAKAKEGRRERRDAGTHGRNQCVGTPTLGRRWPRQARPITASMQPEGHSTEHGDGMKNLLACAGPVRKTLSHLRAIVRDWNERTKKK